MVTTTKINIEGTERVQETVTLVGKVYNCWIPKTAIALKFATEMDDIEKNPGKAADKIDGILHSIFTAADYAKIQKRLEDPKDALDLEDLVELMSALIELAGGEDPTS
jgi:hypothetical protein